MMARRCSSVAEIVIDSIDLSPQFFDVIEEEFCLAEQPVLEPAGAHRDDVSAMRCAAWMSYGVSPTTSVLSPSLPVRSSAARKISGYGLENAASPFDVDAVTSAPTPRS